jgi:hypothetical protein
MGEKTEDHSGESLNHDTVNHTTSNDKIRGCLFTGNGKRNPQCLQEAELRPWFLCVPRAWTDFTLFYQM